MFEAWALIGQLNKFGLKTAEYSFLMIWILGVISVLLLIFLKDRAYRKIAITAVTISIIWVSPVIGYQDITFNSQVKRLEEILIDEGILVNDNIVIADKEVERVKKGEITDAVDFISYSEKSNTPNWFKKDLNDDKIFKNTFGFEKTYGIYEEPLEYSSTNLRLKTEAIDISEYDLSLNMNVNDKTNTSTSFEGKNGNYELMWENESTGIPKITVKFEDSIIIEEDMKSYLSDLLIKYPREISSMNQVPFEDMSIIVEGGNLSILLVFSNIDAYFDKTKDRTDYYVGLQGLYIKYK